MSFEELLGKYLRLRRELAAARHDAAPEDAHIDRLFRELAQLERSMTSAEGHDEQTNDLLPGIWTP